MTDIEDHQRKVASPHAAKATSPSLVTQSVIAEKPCTILDSASSCSGVHTLLLSACAVCFNVVFPQGCVCYSKMNMVLATASLFASMHKSGCSKRNDCDLGGKHNFIPNVVAMACLSVCCRRNCFGWELVAVSAIGIGKRIISDNLVLLQIMHASLQHLTLLTSVHPVTCLSGRTYFLALSSRELASSICSLSKSHSQVMSSCCSSDSA